MSTESQPLATLQVIIDRPRELRLSFRAFKRYATATGKDLIRDGVQAMQTHDDFKVFVWCIARETDPTVTQAQLAPHITTAVMREVASMIHSIAEGEPPRTGGSQFHN